MSGRNVQLNCCCCGCRGRWMSSWSRSSLRNRQHERGRILELKGSSDCPVRSSCAGRAGEACNEMGWRRWLIRFRLAELGRDLFVPNCTASVFGRCYGGRVLMVGPLTVHEARLLERWSHWVSRRYWLGLSHNAYIDCSLKTTGWRACHIKGFFKHQT